MKIALTGADGFLGWHVRCRLHARTDHDVVPIGRSDWDRLPRLMAGVDAVIHLAGLNRAPDVDLIEGNRALASDVGNALRGLDAQGPVILNANSVQRGNGSAYAIGKEGAAQELRSAAADTNGRFCDVLLPNLFGEHGRPDYNSFVATFVERVVRGERPELVDREIGLLHAQGAAAAFIDGLTGDPEELHPRPTETSVATVWEQLLRFHETYLPSGDIPDLADDFQRDLFNTLRANLFPASYPLRLAPRADDRGRLVETVRAHGRGGQSFVSTTAPGYTRGEHYHLHKIERFVVVEGEAVIALRRMFSNEVIEFRMDGSAPGAIDMPTMWAHNITNVGSNPVTTVFWTDSLFDAENPDTIPEPVSPR